MKLTTKQKENKMKTKKLNKTEQLALMVQIVETAIDSNTNLIKANKSVDLMSIVTTALTNEFAPKLGGGTSTKINENGEVYCNYFGCYFPAEDFATKLSKPHKTTGERTEGYKANCKNAEQILRKIKALKTNCTNQVISAFSAKTITADEMSEHLENIDEACEPKYDNLDDVPKSMDVLGLTEAMS